ncbi:MAG: hypothetical protein CR986_09355 [Ignavibacteriae bacterium]|nr:MAG: hypothetical protein CR986_09355 [Ignavibacteriota bacterium]
MLSVFNFNQTSVHEASNAVSVIFALLFGSVVSQFCRNRVAKVNIVSKSRIFFILLFIILGGKIRSFESKL